MSVPAHRMPNQSHHGSGSYGSSLEMCQWRTSLRMSNSWYSSMAIPAVGKQHADDAVYKACGDVGDVVHAAVQAGESDQQGRDEAEKHCGPPQPRARDAECKEGEREIQRGRRTDVSAWIADGRR